MINIPESHIDQYIELFGYENQLDILQEECAMAMDLNAKAAYIRGLMTGMEFDPNSKNGKIIAAMMDLLEEMAATVTELSTFPEVGVMVCWLLVGVAVLVSVVRDTVPAPEW